MRILLEVASLNVSRAANEELFVVIRVEKLPLSALRLVTRVEKEPESVFKFVTRVEKLPLSNCKASMFISSVVNRVDIEALATAKAPLMFEAICAEPDRAPWNIPVNDVADTLLLSIITPAVSNLPNEPVETAEPLKRVSVPLSPKNVDNSLPFCNTNPNEPVEVDEPLMFPAKSFIP